MDKLPPPAPLTRQERMLDLHESLVVTREEARQVIDAIARKVIEKDKGTAR